MVTPTAGKAGYQKQTTDASESQYEMLKNLELSDEMHDQLISHCMSRGIQFLSTGFDIESVDFLLSLGQKLIKIPSGEITNLPLLRHIGGFGFPIILSTGMSTIQETGDALAILESAGALRSQTTVLHCTSEYPAPMNEVNLRAMRSIADTFGVDVGYSDHTLGIEVSIAAVSLGAKVIEKHFTLDRNLPGPDHKASLDPVELIEMIKSIRNIELALGDGIKCPTSSERKNLSAARKSIVAKCKIELGETFSNRNLDVKRSGDGVSPMNWDLIVGQKASREYQINEMIEM
jgi:N,N'-diacetyllegionaminate synthase